MTVCLVALPCVNQHNVQWPVCLVALPCVNQHNAQWSVMQVCKCCLGQGTRVRCNRLVCVFKSDKIGKLWERVSVSGRWEAARYTHSLLCRAVARACATRLTKVAASLPSCLTFVETELVLVDGSLRSAHVALVHGIARRLGPKRQGAEPHEQFQSLGWTTLLTATGQCSPACTWHPIPDCHSPAQRT